MTISRDEYSKRLKDVKILKNISETEEVVLQQYIVLLNLFGHSKKLILRMLQILVAVYEVMQDDDENNKEITH